MGALLSITVSDPATGEVIRRHFDNYAVTDKNADAMPSQLAGNRGQHDMLAVVEADFEECVRLFVNNCAFGGNQIIFCQLVSPSICARRVFLRRPTWS